MYSYLQNNSNNQSEPPSSSPALGPNGLYVWLPILLTLVFGVCGVIYKYKRYHLEKKKGKENYANNRQYGQWNY